MTGKAKFSKQMAKHLDVPVDAACPITRPGGTAGQIGGTVGGAAGAAIAATAKSATSDVEVGQFGWLGLGPDQFAITNASLIGKPTGEPLVLGAYTDVAKVALTEGKLTLRVDLDLRDGRHIAFEAKRLGQGKSSVEVLELLRDRCNAAEG